MPSSCRESSGARLRVVVLEGHALLVVDLEDGQELRKVQALPDPFVQIQEFQLRAEALADLQAGHELARSRAIDTRHFGEIEEDLLPPLGEERVHDVAEDLVADSREKLPLEIDDHDVLRLADFHVHRADRTAKTQRREAGRIAPS